MLTVACVLKSGGIYDATWVARLRDGVTRHLAQPHRFVCLSDVEVPCERIPLEHDWPGWWSKLELFKLRGPVLFFDLDTAIVGDLTDVARVADHHATVVLQDFYRLGAGIGSGVMSWNDLDLCRGLYDRFAADPVGWMKRIGGRGDQGFLEDAGYAQHYGRWQHLLPGQIVSYKVHCRGGQSPATGQWTEPGIPGDARVVCLHGYPKFVDMPDGDAVRVAWERAA
ncbi:hypothetical protein [Bradyrhizobium sp. USDA 4545]|uniref:hypothetical protein n=1 Tax=Bradyrhizobium sp. USDA 4545 TaxID=2817705 RepID=UPI0020A4FBE8|nr:hypothetical protein [Bradyrhizobium sp. USDA 4545]MCP1832830.1 hypothetical protein [Bradyrhizobium sp. USDA 4545]